MVVVVIVVVGVVIVNVVVDHLQIEKIPDGYSLPLTYVALVR